MNARIVNGAKGGVFIGDTAAHTPVAPSLTWGVFYPLTDTILDAATSVNVVGLASSGTTLPAGIPVYGMFGAIKLQSGTGIAYNA